LAIKEYSKEQETEADLEAARALRVFGISREVYVTVLRKLGEYAEKKGHGTGGGLLDDHPSIESRIEKIKKMNPSPD
jgi:Zn-dependent protease with chaperone function